MKRVGDLVPSFESCGVCNKDGWVEKCEREDGRTTYTAERCRCYVVHQQRVLDAVQQQANKSKRREGRDAP
jgi:hypothetical protein